MSDEKTELEEYQSFVEMTTEGRSDIYWAALGLVAETGEFVGEIEKVFRKDGVLTDERIIKMIDELGDVLWFAAACANALDVSLDMVMMNNIDKINKRRAAVEQAS